uniref:Glucagon n=1 Tax=Myotis myotis TaxID=51298 RepID=A0A7J7WGZ5_MYOMY|nr:glucagon [Myotis myotis]
MKSIYFVAGLFVMLVQGSWQRSLQDTEEKSSLFPAPQADSRNDLDQIHKEKRNSEEERILSEFNEFLQNECVQDFMNWLLDEKKLLKDVPETVRRRHVDGSLSGEMNTVHDILANQEYIKWLLQNKITDRK